MTTNSRAYAVLDREGKVRFLTDKFPGLRRDDETYLKGHFLTDQTIEKIRAFVDDAVTSLKLQGHDGKDYPCPQCRLKNNLEEALSLLPSTEDSGQRR